MLSLCPKHINNSVHHACSLIHNAVCMHTCGIIHEKIHQPLYNYSSYLFREYCLKWITYIISTAEQTVTPSSTAKHNGSSTAALLLVLL